MELDRYTSPDLSRAALLTIDVQCDTLDGQPFEIPGTSAVLPRIRRLLDAFRRSRRPVVHVVRIYRRDGSNVDLCRRAVVERGADLVIEDTAGAQLAPPLRPRAGLRLDSGRLLAGHVQEIGPHEVVIYKPRWGAFYQTPLEDHLLRLGVTTLVFTGCNFPNCPRTSIYEAGERDFRLVVAEDAISGLDDRGCRELENIGVSVLSTRRLLERLPARDHVSA